MCGICGWIDLNNNLATQKDVLIKMTNTLSKRGPDDFGYYLSQNALLGHRRLVIVDPVGGTQPMVYCKFHSEYTIVYNGELYNTEDVRKELIDVGYNFQSYSDTEVLLKAYTHWGKLCLEHINGIFAFAIWDEKEKELFMARDHLGVKPLFYTIKNNSFVFGSELKAILSHPSIDAVVDKEGLTQIFSLGPARVLGSAIFKGIYEIPPASYLIFNKDKLTLKTYWKPTCEEHREDVETTAEHLKELLSDAINKQLVADVPVCTFLSGGLDSSIISAIASKNFKERGKTLHTYSIEYEDNEQFFKSNKYQPTSDNYYALEMSKFIGSTHHTIINNNKDLADSLIDSIRANDLPGMADIDSSLYLFCREVRKRHTVALSGECADEIFGGYPWYTNNNDLFNNGFPWYKSLNDRKKLLCSDLKKIDIEDYSFEQYKKTIADVPHLENESNLEYKLREMFYLNIKWFMVTLLNRKDRMSMSNSLEARVPFADYRLVQYAFNIPSSIKFYNGREKGILRKAMEDILPKEITNRKKSPYPKTHNPKYTRIVQQKMNSILKDKSSPILDLIDIDEVTRLVTTGGSSYKLPWFGQLMTGPQLIAYLIGINIWLKEYNVQIGF
ncbi:asparagine synthase (glutamine-hydrolyzing) [Clostridium sediminicola]|uniref:asparagine synthase (glutamine-hydrolyzing) n=1 Tax=Clostridium sediminicola TaxID=3114879 RepID=UPI0031F2492D